MKRLTFFLIFSILFLSFASQAFSKGEKGTTKPEVTIEKPAAERPAVRFIIISKDEKYEPLGPIYVESFEGAWPGAWMRWITGDGWDRTSYRSWDGIYSIYCAEFFGNAPGPYPVNMETWMVWGPFDMSSCYGGWVDVHHWTLTEGGWWDYFGCGIAPTFNPASPDWTQFNYGFWMTGDWQGQPGSINGWRTFSQDTGPFYGDLGIDLSAMFGPAGNIRVSYDPNVWIGFTFYSDIINTYEGTYIDSLTIIIGNPNLRGDTIPSGWSHPLIPSGTTGGTSVPATLPGGGTTYIDHAILSDPETDFITIRDTYFEAIYRDNVQFYTYTMNNLPHFAGDWRNTLDNPSTAIRGGRHTLKHFVDYTDVIPTETSETDNIWGYQWVWSPLALTEETPVSYFQAPRKDDPDISLTYYNCDGFSINKDNKWGVVGLKSPSTDNYDLRLYSDYSGSSSGFSAVLESSENATNGSIDFIMVDGHNASGAMYPGVYDAATTGTASGYYIHWCDSDDSLHMGWNPTLPATYMMNGTDVAHSYEVYMQAGIPYEVGLWCVSGTVNLGLALYSSADGDYYKERGAWFDFVDDVSRTTDTLKYLSSLFTPPVSGYYGIVVWNNTCGSGNGEFRIWINGGGALEVFPDQDGWTDPAVPYQYTLTIANTGVYEDVVDITTLGTTPGWTCTLYDSTGTNPLIDHNGNGIPDVDSVMAGDSVNFVVEITPPVTATPADIDTTIAFGTFTNLPSVYDSAIVRTHINAVASIIVDPDQEQWVNPGDVATYLLTVTNNGNDTDVVDITEFNTTTWTVELFGPDSVTPLPDTDGDGTPDVGAIPPFGGTSIFVVKVTTPPTAPAGAVDTTTATGTSSIDTLVSDNATLITHINSIESIIIAPDTLSQLIIPGGSVDYLLYVINNGNAADVVDITTQNTLTGWTAELFKKDSVTPLPDTDFDGIPDVGPLASFGGTDSIIVRINAPIDAYAGETDSTIVHATSSNNTVVSDTAPLLTVINLIQELILEPDSSITIQPGQFAQYDVRVINNGNITELVDLTFENSVAGWSTEFYDQNGQNELTDHNGNTTPDIEEVMPGDTVNFTVRITPPLNAGTITGTIDTTSLLRTIVKGTSDRDTTVSDTVVLETKLVPEFDIHNYPNPSRGATNFIFGLPEPGTATLMIYTRNGELVKELFSNRSYSRASVYTVPWDAKNEENNKVATGIYLYIFNFTGESGKEYKRIIKKAAIVQ
ncbi:MAG: T9SS type A sorting domain-containing protein [Candidatus Cloacimonadota bacterium]|nr:MAG: T9SS type A sorting domain-containing protein [Candidatus Cloacimonadota bacterium]